MNKKELIVKHIIVNGKMYMFYLQRKNNKNMYLRLTRNNQIIAVANRWISMNEINYFVSQHIQRLHMHSDQRYILIDTEKKTLYFLGKKMKFEINKQRKTSRFYEIYGDVIYFNTTSANILPKIKRFYRENSEKYITSLISDAIKLTRLRCDTITFKWMQSKWGYCNHRERKIVLSTQLVALEQKYINYVILHELAHLIYPNHSSDFWNYLQKYIPNWKALRKHINSTAIKVD